MVITMSRFKREELEKAVAEKIKQGWECVGNGIVALGGETKVWGHEDGRFGKYMGRTSTNKFIVKMRKIENAQKETA